MRRPWSSGGTADASWATCYGFLAGLDYVAVSWPLARFDPATVSSRDRLALVTDTRAAGLAVSEFVVQIDSMHPDAASRAARISHAAEAIRAAAALDLACQAGPAPVNLFSGPAPWDAATPRLGRHLTEGQVPWAESFGAVEAIGYEGYLSVEFESWAYYRQALGNDPLAAARLWMDLAP